MFCCQTEGMVSDTMKIADVMQRKRQRVLVRVPAKLQEKLGAEEAKGTVLGIVPKGSITWVRVKIAGLGEHLFRPQDLEVA